MAPISSPKVFCGRAPGSLILMGEYAVLAGYPALVAAIDQTLTVKLTPRTDGQLEIYSELGHLTMPIDQLTIQAPFDYVLTTLKNQNDLGLGFTLDITSDFKSTLGLGSSAAVTVALLLAFYRWQEKSFTPEMLYHEALSVIREVQGGGSGADVAASVFGGIFCYETEPFSITPLPAWPDITVIYSGKKTTTTAALARLKQASKEKDAIIHALGKLSVEAKTATQAKEWKVLGKYMNAAQEKLVTLGVSTPAIDEIVKRLQETSSIYGAKISGAGLGDCVIGLGTLQNPPPSALNIRLGGQGAFYAD